MLGYVIFVICVLPLALIAALPVIEAKADVIRREADAAPKGCRCPCPHHDPAARR